MNRSAAQPIAGKERASARQSSPRRVAISSCLGTSIEWYDFYIYGFAAALVFNELFFPSFEPLVGTLLAFATFGAGAFARPVGGFIFGHFGDRIGRKPMLVATLLIMGIATLLIGLLPTYATIGVWAPILLVILRITQGFALGGEWSGAMLMAVEHAPTARRATFGTATQIGNSVGLVMAAGMYGFLTVLPETALFDWAWRVPFLLSAMLVLVGLFIRLRLMESPVFRSDVKLDNDKSRVPLVDLVRYSPRLIMVGITAILVTVMIFYIVVLFSVSYGVEELDISRAVLLIGVVIGAITEGVGVVIAAVLADRIGRRRPLGLAGAAFCGIAAFPFFIALNTGVTWLIWGAMGVIMFGVGIVYGIVPAFVSELFPTRIRYTGSSATYGIAAGVFGGVSPVAVTALFAWTGAYWSVALFMVLIASVSFVAFYLYAEQRVEVWPTTMPDALPGAASEPAT